MSKLVCSKRMLRTGRLKTPGRIRFVGRVRSDQRGQDAKEDYHEDDRQAEGCHGARAGEEKEFPPPSRCLIPSQGWLTSS